LDHPAFPGVDSLSGAEVSFAPLGRRKAYEEVADKLRAHIFSAAGKTGERLPTERELAAQFGVSRVVIREAIRALELGGLLQVKKGPKGGIFISADHQRPITESIANLLGRGDARLKDLFEVRLLIEPYAAERVARIGTPRDFAALAALVEEADAEHAGGADIRHLNIELHRRIIRMSRNPVLAVVGETVLTMLADRLQSVRSTAPSGVALELHKQLMVALRKRNAAAARAIMQRDIVAVGKRFALLDAGKHSRRKTGGRSRS
jgi:GntR family transcriptional regulator, transcriptional repressor for pyruvate dehydrogenase complex